MMFVASAPAPLIRTLAPTANPAEMEAADDMAFIVALPSARSRMSPVVVFTKSSAWKMKLSTELLIWLKARETPIETETPAAPATETARLAAPANAVIVETSLAVREMLLASMPVAPSPVMDASTTTPIRLRATTPDPLPAMPAPAPPATAADPDRTTAPMVCPAVASRDNAPTALMLEFLI